MAAKKAAGQPSKTDAITLHDHIKELRNRFFAVAIVFLVVSAVAYNYKDTLIYWLLKPLGDEKLIYLNPAGGFSFIFQVTMYVGIAAAVPFLVYNLYRFVSPALPARAQKHSALVMISSLVLLSIGAAFGYLIAIPGALNFLNNFADGYVLPSLTAESYLNFVLAYTAGLGILFQLPLVLILLHWIHPLKPGGLLKFQRYMILIAFIAAAMITPTPDIVNQLVIALPIIVMYQIGFIAICISVFKARRREKKGTAAVKKTTKKPRRAEDMQPEAVLPFSGMPTLDDVVTEMASLGRPQAATKPVRIESPVSAAAPPPSAPVAKAPKPSMVRAMDVMAPIGKQTARNLVRPSQRPLQPRQVALSVPARSGDVSPGQIKLRSIDGIFAA